MMKKYRANTRNWNDMQDFWHPYALTVRMEWFLMLNLWNLKVSMKKKAFNWKRILKN